MFVFADTSALVKLYFDEEHSAHTKDVIAQVGFPCLSAVSWVEFHSAVHRRVRTKACTSTQGKSVLDQFKSDWPIFAKIEIKTALLTKAGALIARHPLAALDAIQLASALEFHTNSDEPVLFLTYDLQLETAAIREKLTTRI